MISTNSSFTPIDKDIQRRRALAKVYSFLIKLAEEKENKKEPSETVKAEEKTSVPLQNNIPPAV
jgi:hypothetical protein